jgi:GNAT superfamily N-acetyltransferase
MRVQVRPFAADDVETAAELLAARHRAHRLVEPLLPAAYESPDACRSEINAVLEQPDASGAIAYAGSRPVGYLLGAPKPSSTWGDNIWVEQAGHAVEEAEVVRDLYAVAADRWVAEGRDAHYALVPAHDRDLVGAWVRLAFGHQHSHGIREVPTEPYAVPDHITIRRPVRTDIPVLAEIDTVLPDHQAKSPVFSSGPLDTLEERLAEWESDFDDPAFTTFVAEIDGRIVGAATGCLLTMSSSHTGLARPDNTGFLGFAAVRPEGRGSGAGRALGEAVLSWSIEAGHDAAVTDWRATNLLSSRTWPRLGYRESFVRMHRIVGH